MGEGDHGNRTYADYLRLHELLELQSEERVINSDEMHFIIVHQTFEPVSYTHLRAHET